MKHFNAGRHMIATNVMPAIAISLLLASSSATAAIATVTDQSRSNNFDPAAWTQQINDSIDYLNQVRSDIGATSSRFESEDAGAVEAKDIDHVITDLVNKGYIAGTSPVIDLLKSQDIALTFVELDKLVEDTIVGLMVTRDQMMVDSSDDYLGHTAPLQMSFNELLSFGQDLQTVLAATWRDHKNQPSFAVCTDSSAPKTKQTVAA